MTSVLMAVEIELTSERCADVLNLDSDFAAQRVRVLIGAVDQLLIRQKADDEERLAGLAEDAQQ